MAKHFFAVKPLQTSYYTMHSIPRNKALLHSFCILGCAVLTLSFFWIETETTIAQLANTADQALHDHQLVEARSALEQIMKLAYSDAGGKKISWPLLIEYSMKLAHVCESLGESEAAIDVLNHLLQRDLPPPLTPKILLLKARLSAPQHSPEDSYLLLKNLSKEFPMEYWSKEDLSLFQALSYALDEHFDGQLRKAKRLFVTGSYGEASTLYQEVLQALEQSSFPRGEQQGSLLKKKICYALAECAFAESDYVRSLSYIEGGAHSSHAIDRESLYLMAMCYKQQQDYERAIQYLLEYTQKDGSKDLSHYDHALLELGLYYYQRQQWGRSKEYLTHLVAQSKEGRPLCVGSLYLARILLHDHQVECAGALLDRMGMHLSSKDPLYPEWSFLQGEVAYEQGRYVEAQHLYEQSSPSPTISGWRLQAYHQLAWCYIQAGCTTSISANERIATFTAAKQMLEELLPYPVAALSLSKLAILRHQWCNDPGDLLAVEGWIQKYFTDLSFAEQHEALLVRAGATLDPVKKMALLNKATETCYASLPTYVTALYEKTRCSKGGHTSIPQDNQIAEEALQTVLALDPEGPHTQEARYLLGSLYFQQGAFERALPLLQQVAESDHALTPSALFFVAETLCALGDNAHQANLYRHSLYLRFPDSSYAADGCFRCFSFSDYLVGSPEALTHLKQFLDLFPQSPLTIVADYVLSLHQSASTAVAYLDRGIALFESLYRIDSPDAQSLHFYYESVYERGMRAFELGCKDEGISYLLRIIQAFEDSTNAHMQQAKEAEPLPDVVAKSMYHLAAQHIEHQARAQAEPLLFSLLMTYKDLGIQHALYLSLAWQMQGKLALLDHEYERALQCFDIAEEAGYEQLSDMQMLELWLWKGKSHFEAKELDQAMRISSKIINSGLDHPVCVEAMCLRGEIYLLQGRPELASRQWEAMIKKGGLAALRAEQKLRKGTT